MRNSPVLLIFILGVLTVSASEPMILWPPSVLGEKNAVGVEQDVTKPSDDLYGGKRVTRISNVSIPTITLYRPAPDKDTGAAVVVCPGGGYEILSMDLEGTEVCQWLNSIGISAALLKYRVPARDGLERYTEPLQDVQRALGLVRYHAANGISIPSGLASSVFQQVVIFLRLPVRALKSVLINLWMNRITSAADQILRCLFIRPF